MLEISLKDYANVAPQDSCYLKLREISIKI